MTENVTPFDTHRFPVPAIPILRPLPQGVSMDRGEEITLRVATERCLDAPIHLLYLSDEQEAGHASSACQLVIAEPYSQSVLIEEYRGTAKTPYSTTATTRLVLGKHAVLTYYKIQKEGPHALHLASIQVEQAEGSRLNAYSFSLGARKSRDSLSVRLLAEGATCILHGLYVGKGASEMTHEVTVDHLKPHGTSQTIYRGILDDRSRGIFNGKVRVHPGAQKTNAEQSNKNLLLSAEAEADPKPQLEIFADDVKCSHGATVGELDSDTLFYLQSRGIGELEARKILTLAFASELLNTVPHADIRRALEAHIREIL